MNWGNVARGVIELGKLAGRSAVEAGAATAGSILVEKKLTNPSKGKSSKKSK